MLSFHTVPPTGRYCHWYLSPVPEALTDMVTDCPTLTVTLSGCVVIVGFARAAVTVRVAAELVTLPALFDTMQRYFRPLKPELTVKVMEDVL